MMRPFLQMRHGFATMRRFRPTRRGFAHRLVAAAAALLAGASALAWEGEHDEVARLTGEFLPAEIRATFDADDFAALVEYCHWPDMTEGKVRRFRTLDDLRPHVGAADCEIMAARGFYGYWMHTETGKATMMALLARAFGRGDHRAAAFYLSLLSHPVGDESAPNHPTILNFVHYCHYKGVSFGLKKVEPAARNEFGFCRDGAVVRLVRERLKGYRPAASAAGDFRAQQLDLCVRAVGQAAGAAEKEAAIAFGRPGAAEALADLVAMQVRAILDIAWTCWTRRAPDAPLPYDDFQARFDVAAAAATKALDPARQAVFADLFDESKNPKSPKATVAVVCEPLGLRSGGAQSFAGRLVLGACGRTLRDAGYAVRGYDLLNLKPGDLSPAQTPILLVTAGFEPPDAATAKILADYRRAGGKLVYVSGQNPTSASDREASGRPMVFGHGDPFDISGFAGLLVDRAPDELPVSHGWGKEGACPDWRKMSVVVDGIRHPLRRDANGEGYAKPACAQEIRPGEGVVPIAFLDNGNGRFCIAARKGNATWLPVYLLMPFLFSDDTALDFGALRLDSFGRELLLRVLEKIGLSVPVARKAAASRSMYSVTFASGQSFG